MPDVWQSLRTEMDRLFDRFTTGSGLPSMRSMRRMFDMEPLFRWDLAVMPVPAMDIAEDSAGYKLSAELPGLTEKDIEVAVRGDMLTIKGEKKEESETTDTEMHLSERTYGAFSRSFALPESVETDKIAAVFANGVLIVTLPKTKAATLETKTIEVKAPESKPAEAKPAGLKAAA